ncbi:hypothetical protein [Chromobacterium violaceum]|uniref:hypothetical protein n=1 Tax=Chromobacterium violaceum TaxID=536 RepID=UPI0012FD25AC|nr:hypothetical protein [Chromobacterium violaceum]
MPDLLTISKKIRSRQNRLLLGDKQKAHSETLPIIYSGDSAPDANAKRFGETPWLRLAATDSNRAKAENHSQTGTQ